MEIRQAQLADVAGAEECLRLATSSDNDAANVGSEQADPTTPSLREFVDDDHSDFLVARENNQTILGFLVLKKKQQQRNHFHHHLSLLFVRPDAQQKGVGQSLWRFALSKNETSSSQTHSTNSNHDSSHNQDDNDDVQLSGGGYWAQDDAQTMIITVNSSKSAIKFYEKLGFQVTGPAFEKRGRILTPMKLVHVWEAPAG